MQHIKHIVWDLDGVLYEYNSAHVDACYEAYGLIAEKLIDGMDRNTAQVLARKSYDQTRAPVRIFMDEYGVDEQTFLKGFTKLLDVSHLKANSVLHDKIKAVPTTHNILTIADDHWAQRIIAHLGLETIFTPDKLFTAEKCDALHKAESPEPFRIALNAAKVDAASALMIEDSQKNLKHAKELGMTTVWVRPKKGDVRANYTDYVFDTPEEFLDYFIVESN